METQVTKDDLKILLLKCVGSKRPIKILNRNNHVKSAFIKGFADADCSIIMLSTESSSSIDEMNLEEVKQVETSTPITVERHRGKIFVVS
jgi:hypothetical protein